MPTPSPPIDLSGWLAIACPVLLALAGFAILPRVRGTTLTAPALWWMAVAATIAAVEALLAYNRVAPSTLAASLWRYTAAVGTFCPLIAVLGAKRPQDRGWQWVVASLWLVLLVPVAQAVASPSGTQLELVAAWRWLLWGFIVMGLLNYLPTGFMLSALGFAAGQIVMLGLASDVAKEQSATTRVASAVALFLQAWVTAEVTSRWFRPSPAALPQTNRWLAFRDAWGAFWALRVLQRVNQTAELSHWPVRLQWDGFVLANAAPDDTPAISLDPSIATAVDQSLDALLRRFERLE